MGVWLGCRFILEILFLILKRYKILFIYFKFVFGVIGFCVKMYGLFWLVDGVEIFYGCVGFCGYCGLFRLV